MTTDIKPRQLQKTINQKIKAVFCVFACQWNWKFVKYFLIVAGHKEEL